MDASFQNRARNSELIVAQLVETMGMGGAENLAVRIANALAGRGLDSHLIVMTEEGPLSERIAPQVRVHYLRFERASVRNPFAFVASLRRGRGLLAGCIAAEGIDVVQTHLPGANFMGLLLTLGRVCPVLATVHNNLEFNYGDADNPVRRYFRQKAYEWIVRKGAGTVAVSEQVRSSLIETLGVDEKAAARIAVVTNGVELPAPIEAARREELRARCGAGPGVPLLLAAGRFGEQKNFGDLVEAAQRLRQDGREFRLVIGGDGEQRPDLLERVGALDLSDRVSLPGNLSDLNEVMLAADLFCMTSLWEGLPLVLLEAMAAGLPAVGYDIAGLNELLGTGEAGLLAPTGDVEALAAAIGELLDDEPRRRAMGQAARAKVAREYDFGGLVDRLAGLYSAAAAR